LGGDPKAKPTKGGELGQDWAGSGTWKGGNEGVGGGIWPRTRMVRQDKRKTKVNKVMGGKEKRFQWPKDHYFKDRNEIKGRSYQKKVATRKAQQLWQSPRKRGKNPLGGVRRKDASQRRSIWGGPGWENGKK